MITTTTCSNCGAHVSVFRVKAHRRSPVCGEYRRSNEAAARLNAHAGDFVTVVQLITVKLQGLGVRTVLAAGLDELGNLTIVDKAGQVRQYVGDEWSLTRGQERALGDVTALPRGSIV